MGDGTLCSIFLKHQCALEFLQKLAILRVFSCLCHSLHVLNHPGDFFGNSWGGMKGSAAAGGWNVETGFILAWSLVLFEYSFRGRGHKAKVPPSQCLRARHGFYTFSFCPTNAQ